MKIAIVIMLLYCIFFVNITREIALLSSFILRISGKTTKNDSVQNDSNLSQMTEDY